MATADEPSEKALASLIAPAPAGAIRDTATKASVGGKAKVLKITGSGAVKKHIMDMGVTKGAEVFVRKVAPMGDPVQYTVRGYELSLRKDEAQNVVVEPLA